MNYEEQRKKLMKLLNDDEAKCPYPNREHCEGCEHDADDDCCGVVVDFLLSRNVRVLPCNIGDTVYYISTENPHVFQEKELKARKDSTPIQGILITEDGVYVSTDDIEMVKSLCDKVGEQFAYLTKKDAEAVIHAMESSQGESHVAERNEV